MADETSQTEAMKSGRPSERSSVLQDEIHQKALGIAKNSKSRFVREIGGKKLSICRVLTLSPPFEADVHNLPKLDKGRPAVYCPFCGREGSYHLTQRRHHFSHRSGSEDCVVSELESVLHRRAKRLLLEGLTRLRARSEPLRGYMTCRRCRKRRRRMLLPSDGWSTEVEERIVDGRLRLDVAALRRDAVALALEVRVTHAVDDEKANRLAEAGVPGIELAASSLIDSEGDGRPLWRYSDPLPLAERAWHLEAAPRKQSICAACRRIPTDVKIGAKLFSAIAHEDPAQWALVCRGIKAPVDWIEKLSLAEDPGDLLVASIAEPERFRDGDIALDPRSLNVIDFVRGGVARYLAINFGEGEHAWVGKWPLLPDPHAGLASRISHLAKDLEGLREYAQASREDLIKKLQFADRILRMIGRPPTGHRLDAWIGFGLLFNAIRYGNTVWPTKKLDNYPGRLVHEAETSLSRLAESIRSGDLLTPRRARRDGTAQMGLSYLLDVERDVARMLASSASGGRSEEAFLPSPLMGLSGEQRRAVEVARDRRIVVLTGGAGTGKTRTVRAMISALPKLRWLLLAPTGKAAQRLRDAVGRSLNVADILTVAKYLHDLENPDPDDENPLTYTAMVIDEVGFLGIEQFCKVLRRLADVRPRRLILVGDPNQLPSIGAGNTLGDIIGFGKQHADAIQIVTLKENMRSTGTDIPVFARRVEHARKSWPKVDDLKDVRVIPPGPSIVHAVSEIYESELGISSDIQVIAPTQELVTQANTFLQMRLNPKGLPLRSSGAEGLRVGDRVVCTKNYYGVCQLMNGYLAMVTDETEHEIILHDHLPGSLPYRLPSEEAARLTLGYAITIHKAQGSEWETVIVAIPRLASKFVTKAMLYTAVTRARSRLFIVADEVELSRAMDRPVWRYTSLQDQLFEAWRAQRQSRTP